MPHIQRSAEADLDLRNIASHLAQDNPTAASNWLTEMERLFSVLAVQPPNMIAQGAEDYASASEERAYAATKRILIAPAFKPG